MNEKTVKSDITFDSHCKHHNIINMYFLYL